MRALWRRIRYAPRKVGYYWGPRLMSRLRKRWVLFRHPHANIVFHEPVYLGPGFSLHIPGNGTFIAGRGTEFRRNFRAEIAEGGRIVIGEATVATYDVILACGTSIEIGNRVGLGQCLYLTDGNHRWRDPEKHYLAQGYDFRPIEIGDDVAVFSKCTITNSVGKKAVIGANSMVTKPIPPYCLAAGVPARVLEYYGPPGGEPPELAESGSPESAAGTPGEGVSAGDGSSDSASSEASRKSGASA